MTKQTKIVYEHLKDYPTSAEGYRDIKARAVAAAVYCERMSSPEQLLAGHDRKPPQPD